jgi:hypothetical protein
MLTAGPDAASYPVRAERDDHDWGFDTYVIRFPPRPAYPGFPAGAGTLASGVAGASSRMP